jgi:site-specific DNA-methyltransferase (adenine-specific)
MQGDVTDALPLLSENSIDAIVTDPPYALEFMGKTWDTFPGGYQSWCLAWSAECLRVLKPGGHMLAFGGTRTYHRLACAIEGAGFEIRDSLHWIYGSGFPKSLDVSKAIDKQAGAEREVIGVNAESKAKHAKQAERGFSNARNFNESCDPGRGGYVNPQTVGDITKPATAEAKQWEGFGTALKPAHEPIILARKPFKGTVAGNVMAHGTGALNVDGCRVASGARPHVIADRRSAGGAVFDGGTGRPGPLNGSHSNGITINGRWPPNLLLSHSSHCESLCAEDCPVAEMDRQSGTHVSSKRAGKRAGTYGAFTGQPEVTMGHDDTGGASRFFPVFRYQAKAPRSERPAVDGISAHPTVKPLALIRWLVRLITPPGGIVLDPFGGTGTTAQACLAEGFNCLLIEREPDYVTLTEARLAA